MLTPHKIALDEIERIEISPTLYAPRTGDEKLAALVGYMTGDGTIVLSHSKYTKRDGSISLYPRMQGAFYSNERDDLKAILSDLQSLGLCDGVTVCSKKTSAAHLKDGYQIQLGESDCRYLADFGVPIGAKVRQSFLVPDWIINGDVAVKRAYLAALFGAEGTAPAHDISGKSRMPRLPALNMCKAAGFDGQAFFDQLQTMALDLGVTMSVSATGDDYKTYWLRVNDGTAGIVVFFDKIGFAYCDAKELLGWQWSKYLKAYRVKAEFRRETALDMRADGYPYEKIGAAIGLTRGAAHRLLRDIDAGRSSTAGHSFPHFSEWLKERWLPELGLLSLEVVNRSFRAEPVSVMNMLVDSHDHSYVLASGANNFNSFETMSGRVYHAFDRKLHVGNYLFNPKLPIWIGQDFNIDPMTSIIMQPQLNGEVWIVDEVVLFGSNTQEASDKLGEKFFRHLKQTTIYPDPAGQQRGHARGESDLDIMRDAGFIRLKYRRKSPKVSDRINATNRMFKTADGTIRMRVDQGCKHTITAFEQVIYKPGTREVDKTMNIEHAADAVGYCIDLEYPVRKIEIAGVSR